MEERLKQRLVGAAVLVSLAVVFVPMLMDVPEETPEDVSVTSITEIPDRPSSRIQPSVVTTLELPETPRLDAEVERERSRQASGTATEDGDVRADVPARVSISATPEESGDARPAASTAPEAPVSASTSVRPERSEAPAARSSVTAARRLDDASGQQHVPVAPATVTEGWIVQLGSFRKAENARALRKRLREKGYPAFVESGTSAGGEVSRVFVGPMLERGQAKDSAAKLRRDMQLEGIVMPYPGG